MRENLLNELQRDDLPEDLRDVADAIGIEAMRALILRFHGERIYLPFPQRIESLVVRFIRKNYRADDSGSTNVRELAREVGMSVAYVKGVLRLPTGGASSSP